MNECFIEGFITIERELQQSLNIHKSGTSTLSLCALFKLYESGKLGCKYRVLLHNPVNGTLAVTFDIRPFAVVSAINVSSPAIPSAVPMLPKVALNFSPILKFRCENSVQALCRFLILRYGFDSRHTNVVA